MKKLLGMVVTLSLILSMFAGCGGSETAVNGETEPAATEAGAGGESAEKTEKIVIHLHNMLNDVDVQKGLEDVQAMDKFSHVEFVIKEKDEEYETTLPIAVAGGEQIDIVGIFNPILQAQLAQAGVIQPIDELAANIGLDMEAEYGRYAENAKVDGKTVMLPHQITKWVLYYNKSIFDNAGIAYPDSEVPMTWDDYSALAGQLTSGEGGDKIYGALHMFWPMFWYGEAIMHLGGGEHFYNAEGLSNIEDPIFAKALQRTFDMQHVDKSILTQADLVMTKTGPQAFMNGQYGMFAQGAWLLSWATDEENYPRDWELGIAPLPVDAGTDKKTWGVVNGYGIAQTSANPELALEVALELSRLNSKYTEAAPDANLTYPQEHLFVSIGEKLAAEGLSTEVIQEAFNDPDMIFVTEKVTGPNNVQYEQVINEEVEKYFVKEQDLETTIKNIKERGDKAILDD